MPYSVEYHNDLSTIVVTTQGDVDIQHDLPQLSAEIYRILDQADHPVFYYSDISEYSFTFAELVTITNMLVRGQYPFANHPNFRALILVTDNQLASLSAQGMNSNAFGNVQVEVFGNPEQAMDFIQSHQMA